MRQLCSLACIATSSIHKATRARPRSLLHIASIAAPSTDNQQTCGANSSMRGLATQLPAGQRAHWQL